MMPEDFAHMAMWWGPGVLMLLVFSYGLLRLAQVWIERSMESRRRQMESVFGMAEQYVKQFLNAQRSLRDGHHHRARHRARPLHGKPEGAFQRAGCGR
jgi:hypothetical protein